MTDWAWCCGHVSGCEHAAVDMSDCEHAAVDMSDCEHAAVNMCWAVSMLLWMCPAADMLLWTWPHTHLRIENTLLKWFAIDSDITSLHFTVVNYDIYATPSFSVVNWDLKLWMQSSAGPKVCALDAGKLKNRYTLNWGMCAFFVSLHCFPCSVYNCVFSHLTVPQ